MQYDRFELTAREYEAERARAIRQHELLTASQCAQQAQQLPSPLRGWWTRLCRWLTSRRAPRGAAAPVTEDSSIS